MMCCCCCSRIKQGKELKLSKELFTGSISWPYTVEVDSLPTKKLNKNVNQHQVIGPTFDDVERLQWQYLTECNPLFVALKFTL